MQADEEVGKIAMATPVLICKFFMNDEYLMQFCACIVDVVIFSMIIS